MAKIGSAENAWEAIVQISPPLRTRTVKNALPCQANVYFSSSDGCFDNRYDAMRDFEKLRSGEISVKTGWRIYSSGPGIFLNQLISNVLGIRISLGNVIIDPVLPKELDGLHFKYAIIGKAVTFIYHIAGCGSVKRIAIQGRTIDFVRADNPYRLGGAVIPKVEFAENSIVDIYM
jgi:cellobiose phosphorylase